MKDGRKKSNEIIRRLAMVFMAAVFLFSGYKVVTILREYHTGDTEYEKIREMFKKDVTDKAETKEEASGKDKKQSNNKKEETNWEWDYEKLKKINQDAKGYIRQEDTAINYPVLQGRDNEYYLSHTFMGTYNRNGSIFIDYRIQEGFDAKNCVIYGHNMWTDSMFGTLVNYKEQDYFEKHQEFYVCEGERQYIYKVFASFEANAEGDDVYQFQFENEDDFLKWTLKQRNRSFIRTEKNTRKLTKEDHVITLSTCTTRNDESKRVVVLLVREKEI